MNKKQIEKKFITDFLLAILLDFININPYYIYNHYNIYIDFNKNFINFKLLVFGIKYY